MGNIPQGLIGYDRSEWSLCLQAGCPNLFDDGCLGPLICTRAVTRAQGIQIYVLLGDEQHYVTTKAKRH